LDEILRLINKGNDSSAKLGGLYTVEHLCEVIPEIQMMDFVNKLISVVPRQFSLSTDYSIFEQLAIVYGKLVKLGGTKIVQVVENDIRIATSWINVMNAKEIKKYASILLFKELLLAAPVITFTKIFSKDNTKDTFTALWNLIREKKDYIRNEALHFFKEAIKQISQREFNVTFQVNQRQNQNN
jgi:hypothetical protein